MSKKKKEAELFEEWKAEVLESLSDDGKKHFEALLTLEPDGAKQHFRAGLREETFYTRLNDLDEERKRFESERSQFASKQAEIMNWYEQESPKNERLLQERDELAKKLQAARKNLLDLGLEQEANDLATNVTVTRTEAASGASALEKQVAELKQTLRNIDVGLPGFIASGMSVASRIAKENWNVDADAVMAFATKNRVDPKVAFAELTRDEARDREAKKTADLVKQAREEGRKEALSQIPVPDRQRQSGPTIVDKLREADGGATDSRSRVGAAVAEYLSMENVPGV